MIPVNCRMNINGLVDEQWPTRMCCRPQIGDEVRSESGMYLSVVAITHAIDVDGSPILIVELNRRA